MQEAAGSWSGLTNNANTTAKKMGAVLRMPGIYHTGPGASNAALMERRMGDKISYQGRCFPLSEPKVTAALLFNA